MSFTVSRSFIKKNSLYSHVEKIWRVRFRGREGGRGSKKRKKEEGEEGYTLGVAACLRRGMKVIIKIIKVFPDVVGKLSELKERVR